MLKKPNFKSLISIRVKIEKYWSLFNQQIEKILNILDQEAVKRDGFNKKFLFYYISWFSFLFYFTFSFLSNSNPLGLLVPFHLYSYTGSDNRVKVPLYVSDGQKNVYKVTRKVLLTDKSEIEKVETLIGEVGTPPFYEKMDKESENEFHSSLMRLADLRNAVISVWFVGDRLILDLDQSELKAIFNSIKVRKAMAKWNAIEGDSAEESKKNVKEQEKIMKAMAFTSAFMAVERTLFENFKNINTIEYRLNGEKAEFLDFDYDLMQPKKR